MALSVDDSVALVAGLTDSDCHVEDLTFGFDLTADAVIVEVEVRGALGAFSIDPGFTTEIVVDDSEEFGVIKFGTVQVDIWEVGGYSGCLFD